MTCVSKCKRRSPQLSMTCVSKCAREDHHNVAWRVCASAREHNNNVAWRVCASAREHNNNVAWRVWARWHERHCPTPPHPTPPQDNHNVAWRLCASWHARPSKNEKNAKKCLKHHGRLWVGLQLQYYVWTKPILSERYDAPDIGYLSLQLLGVFSCVFFFSASIFNML